MIYKMNQLNEREKYRLLTSCIVPRPIAWVTTMDTDGIVNAAPFSYFTGVSIEPPLVIFAVERRQGEKKDTLINIEKMNEFVVNVVNIQNVQQMNETSRDYAMDENELEAAGIHTKSSLVVTPPAIKKSPIQMECVCDQMIDVGSSPHSLIIGEVKLISVEDSLVENSRINMHQLEAVGRMGGKYYLKSDSLFELDRLDWRHKII